MRKSIALLLALLVAAPALATSGNVVTAANVSARLESAVRSIGPGQSFMVALVLDLRDGWHTYWRNPGDSGRATRLTWTLPAGFRAGPIEWPAPRRFVLAPLVNFGYAKTAVYLVRMSAPANLRPPSPVTLRARAGWLVCSDVCIPESAQLQLRLPTGAAPGAPDPAATPLFAHAVDSLPRAATGAIAAAMRDGRIVVTLGRDVRPSVATARTLQFIPYEDGVIDYAAPQRIRRTDGTIEISMKPGYQPRTGPLRGLVLATERAGAGTATRALAIAPPLTVPATAPAGAATLADSSGGSSDAPGFWALVGLGLLGGLILNLMPCVLPVLSIKAVNLVEQAAKHPRDVRRKGLAFAAGVLASMLALAAVLIALRAGGEQIGWGFQLQSPIFVTLMAYLLFLVGLNLSGVFEFGGAVAGVGERLTRDGGMRGSFFTGVLTTLVASPCSAPFMAAAVGAALTQSAPRALAIFAALGAGLSLPLVAVSFAPWTRRALPRPGPWMTTLRQVLAFPMYASVAWLLWVLAQQTDASGFAAVLAGIVLVALSAWAYRKTTEGGSRLAAVVAIAALIAAIGLPLRLERANAAAVSPASTAQGWLPYDPARIALLRAQARPVLVDFTAKWCLTCLVDERTVLANPAVRAFLRDRGVTLVRADWTDGDPRITRALARFGRAGVPLYVVYNGTPGTRRALILPQLLTARIVEDAFAALPTRRPP
ncbi:MAG TPA: protein-disulfide reductase DsbD domain-containing protein [Steroidobacteraceae bacterium]|nr:protein-disulfide reductase DsbD domain-containing protein [Steroidobacteraceae bacterium]